MPVEASHLLAPSELLHHVAPQVHIVPGSWQPTMCFDEGVSSLFLARVHVGPLDGIIVQRRRHSAQVSEEVDVAEVVV